MQKMRVFIQEGPDSRYWLGIHRSAGRLPKTPLHQFLRWILEQLQFGNLGTEEDEDGKVATVILGQRAAPRFASFEEATKWGQVSIQKVAVAGIFSDSREAGIEPRYVDLERRVRDAVTGDEGGGWGARNTELHYAFECRNARTCTAAALVDNYPC